MWRKLHLAVDTSAHEIIAEELSLSTVSDAEVLPHLLKQTRRKILEISGDGAYDTRDYHAAIRIRRAVAIIPPKKGSGILGKRSSEKFSSWLPKTIWFKQALEKALWLPQALAI